MPTKGNREAYPAVPGYSIPPFGPLGVNKAPIGRQNGIAASLATKKVRPASEVSKTSARAIVAVTWDSGISLPTRMIETALPRVGHSLARTSPWIDRAASRAAYRSEIDGLRALAVVPVVLYHARAFRFSAAASLAWIPFS